MYTARLFSRGLTSLHSNFTWTWSFPLTILGIRKETLGLGYPMVRPHPSAFPRFDTIHECDGRTDGQMDGRICIFAARCKRRDQHRALKYFELTNKYREVAISSIIFRCGTILL